MRFFIIFFTMILLLTGVQALHAFEFIFTPTMSYTNLRNSFEDMNFDDMKPLQFEGAPHLSGWMYGVGMTLVFNEYVALKTSYQYGMLGTEHNKDYIHETSQYSQMNQQNAYSHNVYGAFVFPVSGYVKIFAGMRYMPTIFKVKQRGAVSDVGGGNGRYAIYSARMMSHQYRPVLGLGFSVPFAKYFGFTLNASGNYIFGSLNCTGSQAEYANADLSTLTSSSSLFDYTLKLSGWGLEVEPAFVGFVNDTVWVVVGFRYQYSYLFADGESGSKEISYTGLNEHRYGVLLSVVFRL